MSGGGPAREHAALIARRSQDAGASYLESQIIEEIAAHEGRNCFESDSALAERLRRQDGKPWHRNSLPRARRRAVKKGFLFSERVMPQETPKGAKWPSTQGTTNKTINYRRIGMRSPMNRKERRKLRQHIAEQERQEKAEAREVLLTDASERASKAAIPSVLGQLIERRNIPLPARRMSERAEKPAPVDDRSREERIAEAKRQLAEFEAAEQHKRGPP